MSQMKGNALDLNDHILSNSIKVRRLPGYHSGPVENLDALEARLTAPKSGRFVVTIGR